ncbi:hypothetical protein SAMD00019534_045640 [Acytostelium subglobosum LB1]|uniref:hypothetical protein n=1 Tax=Acytostelium subglobosum LB1 TaxID=1410327 RepID=UPI000644C1EA|nr:hypothetical protein SAMD00019534_045640 [Acytostelium subglobosum LB1]GAM21389.1 hypothetical protein SAMD00019534_045640 [Acytostelium subglobosum LB1]|eukprot:XP_012755508.1 hypothetical protein SAMD00019534_045640 [Acytostelium subglobosum LB1]
MVILRRFFIDRLPATLQSTVLLDGRQHSHLKKSLRMRVGNKIELFDGSGISAIAEIVEIGREQTIVTVESIGTSSSSTATDGNDAHIEDFGHLPRLDIATSLPKAARGDWMVEKLTEIGVRSLYLLETEYSRSSKASVPSENKMDRYQRIIIEAAKQAKVNRMMSIYPTEPFNSFVNNKIVNGHQWSHVIVGHPGGQPLPQLFESIKNQHQQRMSSISKTSPTQQRTQLQPPSLLLMIGPEGGFTNNEIAKLSPLANVYPTNFGNTIMRMETVSIVASGVFNQFYSYLFPPPPPS